jgi:hypothetical protein
MEKENSITTWVHSELILVRSFARNGYVFIDNDKYVGFMNQPATFAPTSSSFITRVMFSQQLTTKPFSAVAVQTLTSMGVEKNT